MCDLARKLPVSLHPDSKLETPDQAWISYEAIISERRLSLVAASQAQRWLILQRLQWVGLAPQIRYYNDILTAYESLATLTLERVEADREADLFLSPHASTDAGDDNAPTAASELYRRSAFEFRHRLVALDPAHDLVQNARGGYLLTPGTFTADLLPRASGTDADHVRAVLRALSLLEAGDAHGASRAVSLQIGGALVDRIATDWVLARAEVAMQHPDSALTAIERALALSSDGSSTVNELRVRLRGMWSKVASTLPDSQWRDPDARFAALLGAVQGDMPHALRMFSDLSIQFQLTGRKHLAAAVLQSLLKQHPDAVLRCQWQAEFARLHIFMGSGVAEEDINALALAYESLRTIHSPEVPLVVWRSCADVVADGAYEVIRRIERSGALPGSTASRLLAELYGIWLEAAAVDTNTAGDRTRMARARAAYLAEANQRCACGETLTSNLPSGHDERWTMLWTALGCYRDCMTSEGPNAGDATTQTARQPVLKRLAAVQEVACQEDARPQVRLLAWLVLAGMLAQAGRWSEAAQVVGLFAPGGEDLDDPASRVALAGWREEIAKHYPASRGDCPRAVVP